QIRGKSCEGRGIAGVQLEHHSLAAQLLNGRCGCRRFRLVAVVRADHIYALACERYGRIAPQSAAGPRNDCDFVRHAWSPWMRTPRTIALSCGWIETYASGLLGCDLCAAQALG